MSKSNNKMNQILENIVTQLDQQILETDKIKYHKKIEQNLIAWKENDKKRINYDS